MRLNECIDPVGWPELFLWLVCIALNSMTLESGRACSLLREYAFFFRSSPVICAFDGIGMMAAWAWRVVVSRERPRAAARHVIEEKLPNTGVTLKNSKEYQERIWSYLW